MFLIRDILTGDSKRYAFVEFRRTKDADRAYAEAHDSTLDGRRILVDREHGRSLKNWKPRRFGGGLGGKRESGQMRFGGRTPYERNGPSRDSHRHLDHRDRNDHSGSHHRSSAPYGSRSSHHNSDHQDQISFRSSKSMYSNGSRDPGSSYRNHSSAVGPIRSSRR